MRRREGYHRDGVHMCVGVRNFQAKEAGESQFKQKESIACVCVTVMSMLRPRQHVRCGQVFQSESKEDLKFCV